MDFHLEAGVQVPIPARELAQAQMQAQAQVQAQALAQALAPCQAQKSYPQR